MALTLDPTPSGTTANTFVDLADAQAIIDATPNSDAWGTDATKQTQALIYATSLLGAVEYMGFKTKVQQALSWPRASVVDPDYGSTSGAFSGYMIHGGAWGVYLDQNAIPTRIIRACVMLALEIMRAGTADVWGIDKTVNIAKKQIDVISTEYVSVSERRFGLRVYPSVWREIYPLTMASQPTSVERA